MDSADCLKQYEFTPFYIKWSFLSKFNVMQLLSAIPKHVTHKQLKQLWQKGFSAGKNLRLRNFPTEKLSLLGVNSFGVWFVSLARVGEGVGLGESAPTVTSVDLSPTELRALSSSLRPKSSSEEWLAS